MHYENSSKVQICLAPVTIQAQNMLLMSVNQRINFGFERLHENQIDSKICFCHPYQLMKIQKLYFSNGYRYIRGIFHQSFPEAVVQMCSVKKVFLEMSQNSQGNTCARVSFLITLQASGCNFISKKTVAQLFSCEFCEIFKNTFFTEHFWTTASVLYGVQRLGNLTAELQKELLLENRLW